MQSRSSSRFTVLPTLLLFATVVAKQVHAQASYVSGVTRVATGELAKELIADMKSALRNLVTAQEAYFSDNNSYGHLLSRDDHRQVFILPPPGVTLTLTYATKGSWTARATHEWLYGISCVIYVGDVPPSRIIKTASSRLAATEEGAPTCDPTE